MTHICPGPGCTKEIDSGRLMCPAHWYQVPKAIRRAVWAAWKDGAGAGTAAHVAAIRMAIQSVGGNA